MAIRCVSHRRTKCGFLGRVREAARKNGRFRKPAVWLEQANRVESCSVAQRANHDGFLDVPHRKAFPRHFHAGFTKEPATLSRTTGHEAHRLRDLVIRHDSSDRLTRLAPLCVGVSPVPRGKFSSDARLRGRSGRTCPV